VFLQYKPRKNESQQKFIENQQKYIALQCEQKTKEQNGHRPFLLPPVEIAEQFPSIK